MQIFCTYITRAKAERTTLLFHFLCCPHIKLDCLQQKQAINKIWTKQAHELQLKDKSVELGLANQNTFLTILEATSFRTDLPNYFSLPRF